MLLSFLCSCSSEIRKIQKNTEDDILILVFVHFCHKECSDFSNTELFDCRKLGLGVWMVKNCRRFSSFNNYMPSGTKGGIFVSYGCRPFKNCFKVNFGRIHISFVDKRLVISGWLIWFLNTWPTKRFRRKAYRISVRFPSWEFPCKERFIFILNSWARIWSHRCVGISQFWVYFIKFCKIGISKGFQDFNQAHINFRRGFFDKNLR